MTSPKEEKKRKDQKAKKKKANCALGKHLSICTHLYVGIAQIAI